MTRRLLRLLWRRLTFAHRRCLRRIALLERELAVGSFARELAPGNAWATGLYGDALALRRNLERELWAPGERWIVDDVDAVTRARSVCACSVSAVSAGAVLVRSVTAG